MSQESLILVSGLLILLVPSLGIPNTYDRLILSVLGAMIAIVGYRLRRAAYLRSLETEHGERRGSAFVESRTETAKSGV